MTPPGAVASRRPRERWILISIFAGVLLVRLIALSNFIASPTSSPSGGDAAFYSEWAQRITAGEFSDGRAFYALPLYAYWLALLYWAFGVSAFVPGFLQSIGDAGTAVLIYNLAQRSVETWHAPGRTAEAASALALRGVTVGALCAGAWAFYPPAQAFSIIRMPTAFGVVAFWFLVWQVVKRSEAPRPTILFLLGVVLGITAMAIATILFVLPLLLAALVWKWRVPGRTQPLRTAGLGLLVLAGIAIGTAPCWLHNALVARDPVFLSAHSGINFWIGNNPEATGYPHFAEVRAGQAAMLQDSVTLAERSVGLPLKRSEVSAFWSKKGRAYIAGAPGHWLQLLGRKIWNFWNAFQYDDLSVVSNLRKQGVLFPGLSFGIIAAIALAGAPIVFRPSAAARWISAGVLLQMVALLPVFVTERYRLPAVPGLIVVAGMGIWQFWESCASMNVRRGTLYIAGLTAAAVIVSSAPTDPSLWALDLYNAGREALEAEDLETAQQELEQAYAYVPRNAEVNLALGNLWHSRRDPARAELYYRKALEIDPNHKSATSNLGVLELEAARYDRAAHLFRKALEHDSGNAKTHYLLAKAAIGLADLATARAELAKALELAPTQPEFIALQQEITGQDEAR